VGLSEAILSESPQRRSGCRLGASYLRGPVVAEDKKPKRAPGRFARWRERLVVGWRRGGEIQRRAKAGQHGSGAGASGGGGDGGGFGGGAG
jgi:hypothetical protein